MPLPPRPSHRHNLYIFTLPDGSEHSQRCWMLPRTARHINQVYLDAGFNWRWIRDKDPDRKSKE